MESVEAYKLAESFVVVKRRQGVNVTTVHDLAAGWALGGGGGERGSRSTSQPITRPAPNHSHGLVGLLLALRFDHVRLISYDLVRRESYDAFLAALRQHGVYFRDEQRCQLVEGDFNAAVQIRRPGEATASSRRAQAATGTAHTALATTRAAAGEAHSAQEQATTRAAAGEAQPLRGLAGPPPPPVDSDSLVLCVHGCTSANSEAIEIAGRAGAA